MLSYLRKNPRRALPVLLALIVAGSAVVATGASFTAATSATPDLQAKELSLGSTGSLTFHDLVPDSTVPTPYKQTFTVTNNGDATNVTLVRGALVSAAGPRGGALKDAVTVKITDRTNSQVVYTGTFQGIPASTDLGAWAAAESRTFDFEVTFPDTGVPSGATTGDNAFQGAALTQAFTWQSNN